MNPSAAINHRPWEIAFTLNGGFARQVGHRSLVAGIKRDVDVQELDLEPADVLHGSHHRLHQFVAPLQLTRVKATDFQVDHDVGSEVLAEALSFEAPG